MTLPQNVKAALASFDEWLDFTFAEYPAGQNRWGVVRDHLLSQEAELAAYKAEMERLNLSWAARSHDAVIAESRLAAATAEIEQLQAGLAKHVNRVRELQSGLAAADALLREAIEWNWLDEDAPQQAGVNADNPSRMDELYVAIQSHLQGAGDE